MPYTIINSLSNLKQYSLIALGYDSIADLKQFPTSDSPDWTQRDLAVCFGLISAFDGNTLIYAWNPNDVSADTGGTVLKPVKIAGRGRWNLMAGFLQAGNGCTIYMVRHYGVGSPEGVVVGCQGDLYVDTANGNKYSFVGTNGQNTGWI